MNPERAKATAAASYQRNKEKRDAYSRARNRRRSQFWQAQLAEARPVGDEIRAKLRTGKKKQSERAWGVRNREHRREYIREWKRAHRARCNEYEAVRRAETTNKDPAVIAYYEHVRTAPDLHCYLCCKPIPLGPNTRHVDHIVPLSKGGEHAIENLAPACRLCNGRKSDFLPGEEH